MKQSPVLRSQCVLFFIIFLLMAVFFEAVLFTCENEILKNNYCICIAWTSVTRILLHLQHMTFTFTTMSHCLLNGLKFYSMQTQKLEKKGSTQNNL